MTAYQGTRPDPVALRTWLTERVAEYLRLPVDEIDTSRRLADYGLDSVYALALCGDIEDYLGIRLEATIVWDYPTVDQLGGYLDRFGVGHRAGDRHWAAGERDRAAGERHRPPDERHRAAGDQ